jgi:AraC-like DNA-binding protein
MGPTSSATTATSNLTAWLTDPRSEDYFGRTWNIRAAALNYAITGQPTLADIALRFGVSRQYVHRQVERARHIFTVTPRVD